MELIKLENVSFSYDNSCVVLDNINLSINQGDFIGIVGQNGSGKSTLLKVLLGIVKVTQGKIIKKENLKIGYVNQTTSIEDNAFPASVYEIVSLGLKKKPFTFLNKEDKEKINKTLELFNLVDLKKKPITALSGGQLQKVKIAKVLISNPDVIILDEPTTGIDQASCEVLLELIYHLSAQKKTIIFVSHNKDDLKRCSRILNLDLNLKEVSNV